MVSRRDLIAGALGAASGAAVLSGASGAAARPAARGGAKGPDPRAPAIAEFFRRPKVGDAALSPRGGRVALLGETPAAPGAAPQAMIQFFDTADMGRPPGVALLPELQAERIAWANEDRLLVWVSAVTAAGPGQSGARAGRPAEPEVWRRVISMTADGADRVLLFETRASRAANPNLTEIVDVLPDDPDHVVMTAWDDAHAVAALYRVNVRDGRSILKERGGPRTIGWRCQEGSAVLRYDMDRVGRVMSMLARTPGETRWRLVRRINRDDTRDFQVVGTTPLPGVVLVSARTADADAAVVRTLDTRTMALGEVVSSRPGRDVADVLTNGRDRFIAAGYFEDRRSYDFAKSSLTRSFRALNKVFNDACNVELFGIDEGQTRWLAYVSGPREPGTYVVYDTARRKTWRLGSARPWLSPDRLATVQPMEVKTRDGAVIRAYLTVPVGLSRLSGPRPLVVLPHGGPEIRDHIDYDPWAQVLAAQGWLVLQPNFRGSGGYGRAFAEAGWKRWGDRMQEDVEDAVDLLVRQRRADPARIAIFGASYGGYAALMGAIRRPDAYKAVVAVAAPSDLPEMMRFQKRAGRTDATVYDFWRARMGDPETDSDRMAAWSPRLRAAEITAPVMLLHGARDAVVPPAQSRAMAAALKAAGRPVVAEEIKGVGHSNWGLPAEQRMLEQVVAFLAPRLA